MDEEINIVEIIKSLRYFNMAMRLLLTKSQQSEIKDKSRFVIINVDKEMRKSQTKKKNKKAV